MRVHYIPYVQYSREALMLLLIKHNQDPVRKAGEKTVRVSGY